MGNPPTHAPMVAPRQRAEHVLLVDAPRWAEEQAGRGRDRGQHRHEAAQVLRRAAPWAGWEHPAERGACRCSLPEVIAAVP